MAMVRGWDAEKKRAVGDTLWCIRHRNRERERPVTIKSVGRKWLQTECGERIARDTGSLDGGAYGSPGRCMESKAEADAIAETNQAWDVFRRAMDHVWQVPAGVTVADIEAASLALRLKAERR